MSERQRLQGAHRIIVKLGTGVITHDGLRLALGRLHSIIEDIAELHREGKNILLVSSGAVGMGMLQLGVRQRPQRLGLRQALAAVGQGQLIGIYADAFAKLGLTTAQVLLTKSDLGNRDKALCLRTTLLRLLELKTIPVLNENDSVSVRELVEHTGSEEEYHRVFGDNDGLSARVGVAIDADLLILLTDVDGLHTGNPDTDPNAQRIPELHAVDHEVLLTTQGQSSGGTGGMTSKLRAARLGQDAGMTTVIASGNTPSVLRRILAGDDLGTVVWPQVQRPARRRAIAVKERNRGALVVNEGALRALVEHKASLLPVGVLSVVGHFDVHDVVEVRDESGRVFGRGMVNYDAIACAALAGRQSSEIDRILGFRGHDALITRDNLVLTEVKDLA